MVTQSLARDQASILSSGAQLFATILLWTSQPRVIESFY